MTRHAGRCHVDLTGHCLALSSIAGSNCAECDWSTDTSAKGNYGCARCDFTGHKHEVRQHITTEHPARRET